MKRFKAKIEPRGHGGAWLCIEMPFDVQKVFGGRGRVSVRGTINGFEFRSSIFPDGNGAHFMMVNKAMQAGADVALGDTVSVTMEADDAPRQVEPPLELKKALAKSKVAREFFQSLSASCRREYADWIAGAKREETRQTRVEKALQMLLSGQKRLKEAPPGGAVAGGI